MRCSMSADDKSWMLRSNCSSMPSRVLFERSYLADRERKSILPGAPLPGGYDGTVIILHEHLCNRPVRHSVAVKQAAVGGIAEFKARGGADDFFFLDQERPGGEI